MIRFQNGKALTRHIHTFRKVTKIVLDPEIPDEQVRPRIFEAVPQAQLQVAHDESGTKARPEEMSRDVIPTLMRNFLRYSLHRGSITKVKAW